MTTAIITSSARTSESTLSGRPRYVLVDPVPVTTGKVAVAKRATDAEVAELRKRIREQGH